MAYGDFCGFHFEWNLRERFADTRDRKPGSGDRARGGVGHGARAPRHALVRCEAAFVQA